MRFSSLGAVAAGLAAMALVFAAVVAPPAGSPPWPNDDVSDAGVVTPASGPPAAAPVDPNQAILPLVAAAPDDPRKVALGRELFADTALSGDNTVSCASCHDLASAGVDGRPRAVGRDGAPLDFNTPSVYNSSLNVAYSWAGAAATLEDQIDVAVLHPAEFGTTWPALLDAVRGVPRYQATFRQIYPAGVTVASVKDAIATFVRSLVVTGAPLDRFLFGDTSALSTQQLRGLRTFTDLGCAACHQGRNVGGNLYQTMGIFDDYFADRGEVTEADLGRYNVTGDPADRHVFRVPSLRNVALTAPYLHDGSVPTLPRMIRIMARYQLGRDVTEAQVADIEAFLTALTGDLP